MRREAAFKHAEKACAISRQILLVVLNDLFTMSQAYMRAEGGHLQHLLYHALNYITYYYVRKCKAFKRAVRLGCVSN